MAAEVPGKELKARLSFIPQFVPRVASPSRVIAFSRQVARGNADSGAVCAVKPREWLMASNDDDEVSPVPDLLLGVAIIAATIGVFLVWNFYESSPAAQEIPAARSK
jgi:hypothetical protein